MACRAYSEQVGWNLQAEQSSGEIVVLYIHSTVTAMRCGTVWGLVGSNGRTGAATGSLKPAGGLWQHSDNLVLHILGVRLGQRPPRVQHHVQAIRQQAPVLAHRLSQKSLAVVSDRCVADLARNRQSDAGW